ncbi:MAG TPA: alanine racemase, partial [Longimicrobiaceae bacterium]|nr:alanine racemase [Longimicrobiaceae bacterium]
MAAADQLAWDSRSTYTTASVTCPSTALRSRAWVEVDLDALCRNALQVQRAAGPDVRLVPMIKADGYGLGMERVAAALVRTLPERAVFAFGVATVVEGERLRASGWRERILVFSPAPASEFDRAVHAELTLCISDVDAVGQWAAAAARAGRQLAFHTEVDTGIGRAGLPWHEAAHWGGDVMRRAAGRVRWEGCYTHFHSADEPDIRSTELQWERFEQALAALPAEPDGEPRRLI